jgi:hypothetical protein
MGLKLLGVLAQCGGHQSRVPKAQGIGAGVLTAHPLAQVRQVNGFRRVHG